MPRIDTMLIKQREIGMMYRESQELQKSQLKKTTKTTDEELHELEEPFDDEDEF